MNKDNSNSISLRGCFIFENEKKITFSYLRVKKNVKLRGKCNNIIVWERETEKCLNREDLLNRKNKKMKKKKCLEYKFFFFLFES